MRRQEMVTKLQKILENWEDCKLDTKAADEILAKIEQLGMKPPSLPNEHCQALMHVYYAGYTFNQWEEQVEKDESVMKAMARRAEKRSRK